jgi:hypothetical protein
MVLGNGDGERQWRLGRRRGDGDGSAAAMAAMRVLARRR